jgi:hypothetical protein
MIRLKKQWILLSLDASKKKIKLKGPKIQNFAQLIKNTSGNFSAITMITYSVQDTAL